MARVNVYLRHLATGSMPDRHFSDANESQPPGSEPPSSWRERSRLRRM